MWLSEDISNHKLHIPGYGIVATLCLTGLDMGRGVHMYTSSLTILLLLVYNLECIVVCVLVFPLLVSFLFVFGIDLMVFGVFGNSFSILSNLQASLLNHYFYTLSS